MDQDAEREHCPSCGQTPPGTVWQQPLNRGTHTCDQNVHLPCTHLSQTHKAGLDLGWGEGGTGLRHKT